MDHVLTTILNMPRDILYVTQTAALLWKGTKNITEGLSLINLFSSFHLLDTSNNKMGLKHPSGDMLQLRELEEQGAGRFLLKMLTMCLEGRLAGTGGTLLSLKHWQTLDHRKVHLRTSVVKHS